MNTGWKQMSMQVSSVMGSLQLGLGCVAQLTHAQHPVTAVAVGDGLGVAVNVRVAVDVAVRVGDTVAVGVRVGVLVCASTALPANRMTAHASGASTRLPVGRLGCPESPLRRW